MRSFVVVGLGQFGASVARTLARGGAEVTGIDRDADRVEALKDAVARAVVADATDERVVRELGLQDVDTAVVAIGENEHASIVVTAILRRLGVERVYARAMSDLHGQILLHVGAHELVRIEDRMGEQIGKSLLHYEVFDQVPLTTGHILSEVAAPPAFVGRTLAELDLRRRFRVNVIAIRKQVPYVTDSGETAYRMETRDVPDPQARIEADDILVLVGGPDSLERLQRETE